MAPPATRIFDVAADLLAAVVDHHGGDLPDRVYVSAGVAPHDCELVSVWCEQTFGFAGDVVQQTTSGLTREASHAMRAGVFVVTIVRCTPAVVTDGPGGDVILPSVAAEEQAAATMYEDAQRVLNALVEAEQAGELPGCNGIAFMEWRSLTPEGGMMAGELRVRVGLATGL